MSNALQDDQTRTGIAGALIFAGVVVGTGGFGMTAYPMLGTQLGLTGASLLLAGSTEEPRNPLDATGARGTLVSVREPAAPRRRVYGEVLTGGVITWMQRSGSRLQHLNLILTLAGHEVEEISELWLNGEKVTVTSATENGETVYTADDGTKYDGLVKWAARLGTDDQTAIATATEQSRPIWWESQPIGLGGGTLDGLRLNGVNHTLATSGDTGSDLDTQTLTVEVACQPQSIGARDRLVCGLDDSWQLYWTPSNTFRFVDASGQSIESHSVDPGQFYVVVFRGRDSTGSDDRFLDVYKLTGTQAQQSTKSSGSGHDTGSGGVFRVGDDGTGDRHFPGVLVYIRVFSAFLSDGTIEGHLSQGDVSGGDGGVEGLWLFDEGSGTTAADSDANGNDLTFPDSGNPWSTSHRQRGCAHAWIRLTWDGEVFAQGLPNIRFKMKGAKVYDPRTSSTGYSNNAALVIADFLELAEEDGGYEAPRSVIDESAWIAAANACEELVPRPDGENEQRYTINGVTSADEEPEQVLTAMLQAMAGRIAQVGGPIRVLAGVWRTAGVTLDDDDLMGPLGTPSEPISPLLGEADACNAVRATFMDPERGWQPTDAPPITNATYESNDGNRRIWKELGLRFTTSAARAQRLEKITLEEHRQEITLSATYGPRALQLVPGDVVYLTHSLPGWTAKPFLVEQMVSGHVGEGEADDAPPMVGARLSLRETASGVFDWNAGEETTVDLAPNTDLPAPGDVAPPSELTLSVQTASLSGRFLGHLLAEWTAPDDEYVQNGGRIEIQYKKSSDSTWLNAGSVEGDVESFDGFDVEDAGKYHVRMRSRNAAGAVSPWVTSADQTMVDSRVGRLAISNWTVRDNPKGLNLQDVVWAAELGLAIAVGWADTDAYIITSPDGVTWTERSCPGAAVILYHVTYAPSLDLLVAVGEADATDALIVSSSDGITWTEQTNPKAVDLWGGVEWVEELGLFVAVGAADGTDAYIVTSPDGTTWTERSNPTNVNLEGLTWSPELELLVAVGESDGSDTYILTSSDGITWTEQSSPNNTNMSEVTWSPALGLFAAAGAKDGTDANILTSPDGTTWTERSNPKDINLHGITWSPRFGLFLAAGDQATDGGTYVLFSADGETWKRVYSTPNAGIFGVEWMSGLGLFVMVGPVFNGQANLLTSLVPEPDV